MAGPCRDSSTMWLSYLALLLKALALIQDIPTLVQETARRYELKPEIVAAMVYQESGGNVFAVRYEPRFYHRYVRDRNENTLMGYVPHRVPTLSTEKRLRAFSFGLLQIMGETARWPLKFDGPYLTYLLQPEINLDLGCRYLRMKLDDTSKSLSEQKRYELALKGYNGGWHYPKLIFEHVAAGRHQQFLPNRL